jgi:hypothetical protein
MPAWSLAAPEWVYRPRRLRRTELMDRPGLPKAERDAALAGLERLSAWPGSRGPLLESVRGLLGPPDGKRRRLVELGAGGGGLARWLAARMAALGHRAEVLATDLVAAPGVRRLDALSGRLPAADLYYSNLMLHHLDDDGVARLLRRSARASALGVVHIDVQRHWLHYYGAVALLGLGGFDPINQIDARLSIQQGYTRAEMEALARGLGPGAALTWHVPFRWRLAWKRP